MRKSGQSLIEVTIGIVVLVPVTLTLIDLSVALWGVQENDHTCMSAARAAASGAPEEATDRAQIVLDRADGRGPTAMVSNSVLACPVQVDITSKPETQRDPVTKEEVNPGGAVVGSVTVTSEVEVKPFLLHSFFTKAKSLKFTSQHSCPITYVVPAITSPEREKERSTSMSSDSPDQVGI